MRPHQNQHTFYDLDCFFFSKFFKGAQTQEWRQRITTTRIQNRRSQNKLNYFFFWKITRCPCTEAQHTRQTADVFPFPLSFSTWHPSWHPWPPWQRWLRFRSRPWLSERWGSCSSVMSWETWSNCHEHSWGAQRNHVRKSSGLRGVLLQKFLNKSMQKFLNKSKRSWTGALYQGLVFVVEESDRTRLKWLYCQGARSVLWPDGCTPVRLWWSITTSNMEFRPMPQNDSTDIRYILTQSGLRTQH